MRLVPPLATLRAIGARFRRAAGGNLSITFGIAAVPIIFALGASADYGVAVKTRARMNAAADAAALSALTPAMMASTTTIAKTRATAMFNTQVAQLQRLTYDSANLTVTVDDATVNSQRVRTATVTYSAASQTAFAKVLNMSTIAIGGTSTATASTSPNIDFYLMLDTSPSMAIPSSTAGIDWMTNNSPNKCAFACHEKYPAYDGLGSTDNYTLAKNNSITLRMDLVTQAVSNLVDTAKSTAAATGAVYRLAGYTFDVAVAKPIALQLPTSTTKTLASAISMLVVDYENVLNGVNNNDMDTNFDLAFTKLSSDMTAAGAGNGTNATGDKPQQILMIVTDGVSDQLWNAKRIYTPLGGTTTLASYPTNDTTDWCTTIKAKTNTRIAVLYLTYNPMTSNYWYNTYIAPLQADVSPTLKNCASSGLFFQVDTNGDVSTAMSTLFSSAVKTARLSN